MSVFFLDRNPQTHQLPSAKLYQMGCPCFTSGDQCEERASQDADVKAFLHAFDDSEGKTGAKLAAAGCAVYYYSIDATDAFDAAASARERLSQAAAVLVEWCELDRLRSGICGAVLSGDFSAVTSHAAIEAKIALEALAVLSQGYFATQAIQDQGGKWGPRVIDDILENIGWVALAHEAAGQAWRGTLPARAGEVAKPAWWRNALGLTREQLTSRLKAETGQPLDRNKPLECLLKAIYPEAGGEESPIRVETVAKAFRCIGALLRE
jgi:hypothetical protein